MSAFKKVSHGGQGGQGRVVVWGVLGCLCLLNVSSWGQFSGGGGVIGSDENTAIADSYAVRSYDPDFVENEYGTGQSGAEAKTVVRELNVTALLQSVSGCLIVNGDFETGDFTGWTKVDSGSGTFVINDGTLDPDSPDGPIAPCGGCDGFHWCAGCCHWRYQYGARRSRRHAESA